MGVRLCKFLIFSAGAVIGAVISAFATKKVLQKKYWDEFDRELNDQSLRHKDDMKELKEENESLKATITQQNVAIKVLSDQVSGKNPKEEGEKSPDEDSEGDPRGSSGGENGPEREIEAIRRRYSGENDDEDDGIEEDIPGEDDYFTEEEAEMDELVVMSEKYHRIDEVVFDTTCFDYRKEELIFYRWDGKMVTEDGEWLEKYPEFVGDDWVEGAKNGDVIFIRNDYWLTDYRIEVADDFGEGHITYSDSEWED